MDVTVKVDARGQVTIPASICQALGIAQGDSLVFRVDGQRALLARVPEFLALSGTMGGMAAGRDVAWDEVRHCTRTARAAKRG